MADKKGTTARTQAHHRVGGVAAKVSCVGLLEALRQDPQFATNRVALEIKARRAVGIKGVWNIKIRKKKSASAAEGLKQGVDHGVCATINETDSPQRGMNDE